MQVVIGTRNVANPVSLFWKNYPKEVKHLSFYAEGEETIIYYQKTRPLYRK